MTTIAYAGGIMAADTLVVENNVKRLQPVEKIHIPGPDENWKVFGVAVLGFGFAGSMGSISAFKKYLQMNMAPTVGGIFTSDNNFAALIVDENLDLYKFNHKQSAEESYSILVKETDPETRKTVRLAIGSGQDFALTALALGNSPAESVIVASNLDVYTNNVVSEFDFNKLLK